MRSGGAVMTIVVIGAVLFMACGGDPSPGGPVSGARAHERVEEPEKDVIAVEVGPVRVEPVSAIYSTSTTLRADKRATVIARTQGVIRQLLVEEGDLVSEGQPLAVLEDDEQSIEAERTRAAYDVEEREFQRAQNLHDEELVSYEDYETSRRELEDARHARSRAELELERTVIRAPFSGKILRRHLDVGATVRDSVAVYDLADLDPLYADVHVPERHIARLAPGQNVRLTADASREEVMATIERIAPAVEPATGTVKVTLTVDRATRLRPGAFVRAEIITETHDNALVVPRSALVAEGRRWNVYRLASSGSEVERIEVVLGFEEGDRVEIDGIVGAGPGLEAGDRVVVVGAPALSDGASVEVVEDGDAGTGEVAGESA